MPNNGTFMKEKVDYLYQNFKSDKENADDRQYIKKTKFILKEVSSCLNKSIL